METLCFLCYGLNILEYENSVNNFFEKFVYKLDFFIPHTHHLLFLLNTFLLHINNYMQCKISVVQCEIFIPAGKT